MALLICAVASLTTSCADTYAAEGAKSGAVGGAVAGAVLGVFTGNIGGSMGIASVTTYLFRREQFHISQLSAHVQTSSLQTRAMVGGMRGAFIARGADPHLALDRAFAALWGMVQRQASMAAFVDTFLALAWYSSWCSPGCC